MTAEQEDFWHLPVTTKAEAGTKIKAGQVVRLKDGKVYPVSQTTNDAARSTEGEVMKFLKLIASIAGLVLGISLTLVATTNDEAPKLMIISGVAMTACSVSLLVANHDNH